MRMVTQTDLPVDLVVLKGSVLAYQRNALLQRMRGDWLLFIDDDMQWEPDALAQLLETKAALEEQGIFPDVLGALCFRRAAPYQPTIYVQTENGYAFLESWDTDVVDIDATGMAFALVTKQGIERMIQGPMPPYEDRIQMDGVPDIFKWYGQLGEDLRFCQDVKAAGGRVMVDTRIQIRHIGEKAFGMDDYLMSMWMRSEDEVALAAERNATMKLPTLLPEEAKRQLDGLGRRQPSLHGGADAD